jgi:type II secretory pathway pseudopilin PulG
VDTAQVAVIVASTIIVVALMALGALWVALQALSRHEAMSREQTEAWVLLGATLDGVSRVLAGLQDSQQALVRDQVKARSQAVDQIKWPKEYDVQWADNAGDLQVALDESVARGFAFERAWVDPNQGNGALWVLMSKPAGGTTVSPGAKRAPVVVVESEGESESESEEDAYSG